MLKSCTLEELFVVFIIAYFYIRLFVDIVERTRESLVFLESEYHVIETRASKLKYRIEMFAIKVLSNINKLLFHRWGTSFYFRIVSCRANFMETLRSSL